MSIIAFIFIAFIGVVQSAKSKWFTFELNENSLIKSESFNYETSETNNLYEINLSSSKIVAGQKLFLILESNNPDFTITLLDDSKGQTKASEVLELNTFSGNIMMVMTDKFFSKKLQFFKKSGSLKFAVINRSKEGPRDYKIRVEIAQGVTLELGKIYTARLDKKLKKFNTSFRYNGLSYPELQKLRFQVSSVRQKKDYLLEAKLSHSSMEFDLNPIFQKTVGGILTLPKLPVCKEEFCLYDLKIASRNVKVVNIETFIISKIERLSIKHFDEYYDRVYDPNSLVFYELPYEESMKEMDVSISLIPVIGETSLYVNAQTLPLNVELYTWKEKGPLAKRITIKWDELVQMKAEKSSLYIAVNVIKPSEFLIKIDAHDPGYKGRLNSGIVEAGFVEGSKLSNYLYFFEVFETQTISFDLKLMITVGDADLYLKKCDSSKTCQIEEKDLWESNVIKVENNQNSKIIAHTFECINADSKSVSACQFVIGVKGKESLGTHYEISLQESNFHRLMIPGHSFHLNLNTHETVYLKFSNPSRNINSQLFFSIEALWGSFDVILSKHEVYPNDQSLNIIKESFVSTKLGLYDSLRTIKIDPTKLGDASLLGGYFVAVQANTSCSMNIKFFEKNDKEISLNTLIAGNQVRGEITHKDEIVYYTIRVPNQNLGSGSVNFVLTPLKGQYTIFANSNGKLPTKNIRELISTNNHLEIPARADNHTEYIVGVQLTKDEDISNNSYQFLVSFVYSNKPLKLNPGILSTHMVSESNDFLIEVGSEMKSILIIKTIVDGYNLGLCAKFASVDTKENISECDFQANDKLVSIYINQQELESHCKSVTGSSSNSRCFIQLSLTGNLNQKFSIGFTYDDHPIHLVEGQAITGPLPLDSQAQINFIYHPEPDKPVGLFFNSKGRSVDIFTKLVRSDHFNEFRSLSFPSASNYDAEAQHTNGHITNIYYDEKMIGDFGNLPELLISIRNNGSNKQLFDSQNYFVLQSALEAHEILRTQVFNANVKEDQWTYYTFYNNGNSNSLKVYVSSTIANKIEVQLSRGLQSRPPFTNTAIISKTGIGSVELNVDFQKLKLDLHSDNTGLRGHYTVAVKSSSNCGLSIFWNNKEELNYIELTPNQPSTMMLNNDQKFFFTFYAQDTESKNKQDQGDISIHIKTSIAANIYLIKSSGELNAPSSADYTWKGSLEHKGGVTMIKIKSSDPEYCVDCLYIGAVESTETGQISLLANIKHDKIPVEIVPGFTIPDAISTNDKLFYRVFNSDKEPINLSVSMLTGFVNIYISGSYDVSEDNSVQSFSLSSTLDTHKFIQINPAEYKFTSAHNYYVLITNNKFETATFTLSVHKNSLKSPIEPGITKFLQLSPGETTDLIYTPHDKEKIFEVKMELKKILNNSEASKAMNMIHEFISVNHINELGSSYKLKHSSKSASNNKLYMSFDISGNPRGTFSVHLTNPTNTEVALSLDLLSGGYKLVNLNEFNVDMVKEKETKLYEAYGQQSKLLYLDLKVCHGDVDVQFYQSDNDNVTNNNSTEFEKLGSQVSSHFIKLEHEKAFLKIMNKVKEPSIYEISLFSERDLNNNPYSEVSEGNGGRVQIDTDKNLIHFHPVTLSSNYGSGFFHGVNYTVYITDDAKKLKYLKNCGTFMINQVFDSPNVLSFSHATFYDNESDFTKLRKDVKIKVSGLQGNTKYYGVVVAKVNVLPAEDGYLSPVRTGKVFYDQFVFVTPRFDLPVHLIITTLVLAGFFICLICIIQVYIFGKVGSLHTLERLGDLTKYDGDLFNMKMVSILEKEYYGDTPSQPTQRKTSAEGDGNDIEFGSSGDFEMSNSRSRNHPLNL